jgi:hypothetical protein
MNYNEGDIFKIKTSEAETYVIVNAYNGQLGFKSLILNFEDKDPINIEMLRQYEHEYLCSSTDIKRINILGEMSANYDLHKKIWEMFDAEGWQSHYDTIDWITKNNKKGA